MERERSQETVLLGLLLLIKKTKRILAKQFLGTVWTPVVVDSSPGESNGEEELGLEALSSHRSARQVSDSWDLPGQNSAVVSVAPGPGRYR